MKRIIILFLLVAAIGGGVFYYYRYLHQTRHRRIRFCSPATWRRTRAL